MSMNFLEVLLKMILMSEKSLADEQGLLMAYSFANSFDYTNASGVDMDSNPSYINSVSMSSIPYAKYKKVKTESKNNSGNQGGLRLALTKFTKSKTPVTKEPILVPGRIIIRPENVK